MLAQDLLLFDLELASQDAERGAILQLSAQLLDAKNLLEKKNFNIYARPSISDTDTRQYAKRLGVTEDSLRKAPRLPEVLREFTHKFRDSHQLACLGASPFIALGSSLKKAGVKQFLELPIFDAWTPLYLSVSKFGTPKLPNLETLAGHFKLTLKNPHDAMERVRLTAELLRKIL